MKKIFCAAAQWLMCGLLLGCQSSPAKKMSQISLGASKGHVLGALGSPTRTYRKNDTDRWVYQWNSDDDQPLEKEIWFQNGLVVYTDGESSLKKDKQKPSNSDFVPVE